MMQRMGRHNQMANQMMDSMMNNAFGGGGGFGGDPFANDPFFANSGSAFGNMDKIMDKMHA